MGKQKGLKTFLTHQGDKYITELTATKIKFKITLVLKFSHARNFAFIFEMTDKYTVFRELRIYPYIFSYISLFYEFAAVSKPLLQIMLGWSCVAEKQ